MCDVHERQYSDLPRQRDNQDHVVRAKCAAGLKHTYLYRRTDVLYPWRRISCRWLLRRVFLTILSRWTVAALISSVRIDSVTSSSFVDLQVTHVLKSNFSNLLAVFPTDSSKVRKKTVGPQQYVSGLCKLWLNPEFSSWSSPCMLVMRLIVLHPCTKFEVRRPSRSVSFSALMAPVLGINFPQGILGAFGWLSVTALIGLVTLTFDLSTSKWGHG